MHNLSNQAMQMLAAVRGAPQAAAAVRGNGTYSSVTGTVLFFQTAVGVLVIADVTGLPNHRQTCQSPVFAFHIHAGSSCTGSPGEPFENTQGHYNPGNCPHPYHAGDLPPLFGNQGYAFEGFLTNRFTVQEILGRTILIHGKPDDFTTQPSGNAGERIACGEIRPFSHRRTMGSFF